MPCYHPLLRIPTFFDGNDELQYKVISYDEDLKNKTYKINHPNRGIVEAKAMPIPCGQCVGCRLDYSQQWATRCMLELPYHDEAWFVTLTYDDYHLDSGITFKGKSDTPCLTYYSDPETGEAFPAYSLRPDDLQKFMKRLRKKFYRTDKKGNLIPIRFYACGEYGGQTQRPHYHGIIFGLKLDDLVFYKKNDLGQSLYNSESFQSCWSDDNGRIGYAVLAEVSWESCAYVARYMMKKQKGEGAKYYKKFNIEPEFTRMSNKPGIGRKYLEDHPEIYKYDQINISTLKGGIKVRPPKYYDRIFDDIAPEQMKEVKENRQVVAEAISRAKMAQTSLPYIEMLAVEEANRKAKTKILKRKELRSD